MAWAGFCKSQLFGFSLVLFGGSSIAPCLLEKISAKLHHLATSGHFSFPQLSPGLSAQPGSF